MKFILGRKLEMSQVFDEKGNVIPVTLVEAGPCFVTQIKTKDGQDKYGAVQIGFGQMKESRMKKPQIGHLLKAQSAKRKAQSFGRHSKEFRVEKSEYELGAEIKADVFQEGDAVKVAGFSKGKGFQGVVKRHGFGGAPKTHGTKHAHRQPGSIGATFPERVPKGRRMAGRMGYERVTQTGLKIIKIDAENNVLAISGAVPGKRGTLLEIRSV